MITLTLLKKMYNPRIWYTKTNTTSYICSSFTSDYQKIFVNCKWNLLKWIIRELQLQRSSIYPNMNSSKSTTTPSSGVYMRLSPKKMAWWSQPFFSIASSIRWIIDLWAVELTTYFVSSKHERPSSTAFPSFQSPPGTWHKFTPKFTILDLEPKKRQSRQVFV